MHFLKTRHLSRVIGGEACSGFTILELALTLAIMGMLASAILVPFVTQVTQRNITRYRNDSRRCQRNPHGIRDRDRPSALSRNRREQWG